MKMNFKNTFGAVNSQMDLQRQDLFIFRINLPTALKSTWNDAVEFAVEKFPFPARDVEMLGIKYMQQTNFLIGGDTPTPAIEIPIRYAFAQATVRVLEKWMWLIRNPRTGGVGMTSLVKADGWFQWIVPNQANQDASITGTPQPGPNTMNPGLTLYLEGCLIKGLKFSDADMTTSGKVDCQLGLQIDRWYPANIDQVVPIS